MTSEGMNRPVVAAAIQPGEPVVSSSQTTRATL